MLEVLAEIQDLKSTQAMLIAYAMPEVKLGSALTAKTVLDPKASELLASLRKKIEGLDA
ncbi:MAG TPA: hypothetical protein VGS10_13475 [Terracidiphilus sp.]|nr:hypothetical protein [Terracidiphilus sp.]